MKADAILTAAPSAAGKAGKSTPSGENKGDTFNAHLSAAHKAAGIRHGHTKKSGGPDSKPASDKAKGDDSSEKHDSSRDVALLLPTLFASGQEAGAAVRVGGVPPPGTGALLSQAARSSAGRKPHKAQPDGADLPSAGKALPVKDVDAFVKQLTARLAAVAAKHDTAPDKGDGGMAFADRGEDSIQSLIQSVPSSATPGTAAVPLLNGMPQSQPAPAPQQPVLNAPLGTQAWQNDFSQQVLWLVKQDVQGAKLHLHPHDLGSIDVHIQLVQNQTQVWFHADHPATREAMQASLPRLQQMFDQQGLGLAGAHVLAQGFGSGGDNPSSRQDSPPAWLVDHFDRVSVGEVAGPALSTSALIGLVDAYA